MKFKKLLSLFIVIVSIGFTTQSIQAMLNNKDYDDLTTEYIQQLTKEEEEKKKQQDELNKAYLNAVKKGNFDDVKKYIQQGADINYSYIKSKFLSDPLNYAIGGYNKDSNLAIIQFLLDNSINTTDKYHNPYRNIFYAILEGKYEATKLLINHNNFDINQRNYNEDTPLIYAAGLDFLDYVRSLVEHGADVYLEDRLDMTAYERALRSNRPQVVTYLQNVQNYYTYGIQTTDPKNPETIPDYLALAIIKGNIADITEIIHKYTKNENITLNIKYYIKLARLVKADDAYKLICKYNDHNKK